MGFSCSSDRYKRTINSIRTATQKINIENEAETIDAKVSDASPHDESEPDTVCYQHLVDQIVIIDVDGGDQLILRNGPGKDYRESFELTGVGRLRNGEKLLVI